MFWFRYIEKSKLLFFVQLKPPVCGITLAPSLWLLLHILVATHVPKGCVGSRTFVSPIVLPHLGIRASDFPRKPPTLTLFVINWNTELWRCIIARRFSITSNKKPSQLTKKNGCQTESTFSESRAAKAADTQNTTRDQGKYRRKHSSQAKSWSWHDNSDSVA